MSTVHELLATDQTFREVAELLFGGGGDELISKMGSGVSKMNPAQSDLSTHERKKRAATAALSGVGAAAGAGGLALAGKEMRHGYKAAKIAGAARPLRTALKSKRLATALLPLEAAGLGGELMATKILHGDVKKPKGALVKKDLDELLNNSSVPTKGSLTRAAVTNPKVRKKGTEYAKKGAGALRRLPSGARGSAQVEKAFGGGDNPVTRWAERRGKAAPPKRGIRLDRGKLKAAYDRSRVQKGDTQVEVIWNGEIAKADADKQQIFGWASVVELDGEPVVDLQGDIISAEEMEKAAYTYVSKSRKGGDMHLRNDWQPVQKSEMIESFIVTPEKRDAMGLPGSVPTGWWVGFQVQDPQVWADIRSGKRTGFSIHGHGRRSPAEA